MKNIIFSLSNGQELSALVSNPAQVIADVHSDGYIMNYPVSMISSIEVEK